MPDPVHACDHTATVMVRRSGAWVWSGGQRVRYANDLVDPGYLIAIEAFENRQVGAPDASTPAEAARRVRMVAIC